MVVLNKQSKRTNRTGKNLRSQRDAGLAQATATSISSEKITGTEITDTLDGGKGADEIEAGPSDDVVEGGTGDDTLNGGRGDDTLEGGEGSDEIEAGSGEDLVDGGDGADLIEGERGDDILIGGDGNDTLEGGAGNDLIRGEGQGDELFGGAGDDTLEGGSGYDLLEGGEGADQLYGGTYNDTLIGGDGDDTLNGGSGQDLLKGGTGHDVYVLSEGNDTIEGYNAGDQIILSDELKTAGLSKDKVTIEAISVDGEDAIQLRFEAKGKTHSTTILDAKSDISIDDFFDVTNIKSPNRNGDASAFAATINLSKTDITVEDGVHHITNLIFKNLSFDGDLELTIDNESVNEWAEAFVKAWETLEPGSFAESQTIGGLSFEGTTAELQKLEKAINAEVLNKSTALSRSWVINELSPYKEVEDAAKGDQYIIGNGKIESINAKGNINFQAQGPSGDIGVYDFNGIKITGGSDTEYIKAHYNHRLDDTPPTIKYQKGDAVNSVTFYGSNLADTFTGGDGDTFVLSEVPYQGAQDVILKFSPSAGDKIGFPIFDHNEENHFKDLGDIEEFEKYLAELVSDVDKAKEEAEGTLYEYGYVIDFAGISADISTRILTDENLSKLADELPVYPIEGLDENGFTEDDYHVLIYGKDISEKELPFSGQSAEFFESKDLGDGTFEIRAVFDWYNSKKKWLGWLLDIKQIGSRALKQGEEIDSEKLTASGRVQNQLKEGAYAFYGAGFESSDAVTKLDTSNLEDMGSMFEDAEDFNDDIGDWDVSNVNNMNGMFENAKEFNAEIGDWDVRNVEDFSNMFSKANAFNSDIGDWNVNSARSLAHMFYNSNAGLNSINIGNWDVSSVQSMQNMFTGSQFSGDIGDWDVSSVKNMQEMFDMYPPFNSDIGDWDVSGVTNMDWMFDDNDAFDRDLSRWNIDGLNAKPEGNFSWAGSRSTEDGIYSFVNLGQPNFDGGDVDGNYDNYSYYEIIGTDADESYGGSGLEDGYSIRITPIPQSYGGEEARYSWGVRNEFGDRVDFKGTKFNNLIDGQGGDDVLFGGDGDDILIGGAGKDVYQLAAGDDTIAGFVSGKDSIVGLEEYGWSEEETKEMADAAIKSMVTDPTEEIDGHTFKYKYTLNYTIGDAEASTAVYSDDRLGDGELVVTPEPEPIDPGNPVDPNIDQEPTFPGTTPPKPSPEIDADGNGVPDREEIDSDGDGSPDFQDPDDDGDGIPDSQEEDGTWDNEPVDPDQDDVNELRTIRVVQSPTNKSFSSALIGSNDLTRRTDRNDKLQGTDEEEKLHGRRGKDTLAGGGGDDYLFGGANHDILRGGAGDDVLQGSHGNDILKGGEGDDVLYAGLGHDELTGGKGEDIFVLSTGQDVITDFQVDKDDIGLVNPLDLTFTQKGDDLLIRGNDEVHTLLLRVDKKEFLSNYPNNLQSVPAVEVEVL